MRNVYKQYGRVTLAGTGDVGNSKQRDTIAARWTTSTSPRSDIDAQALRVFAASGFGDATIGGEPHRVLDSVDHYHRARAHRSYMLAEIVKTMLQAVGDVVRRMVLRTKLRQRAYATYRALNALDTSTLRDLGFHRSELMSVAAEMSGAAETTRGRLIERC